MNTELWAFIGLWLLLASIWFIWKKISSPQDRGNEDAPVAGAEEMDIPGRASGPFGPMVKSDVDARERFIASHANTMGHDEYPEFTGATWRVTGYAHYRLATVAEAEPEEKSETGSAVVNPKFKFVVSFPPEGGKPILAGTYELGVEGKFELATSTPGVKLDLPKEID